MGVEHRSGPAGVELFRRGIPHIVDQDDQRIIREGCLSVPDYTGNVLRYGRAVVEGMTQEGRPRTIIASGFEALAFQHEVDHLRGMLFLDRIQSLSTDLFRRRQGGTGKT